MTKVHIINGEHETLAIVHCPGCNIGHPFRIKGDGRPKWTWNGDKENPTFAPSMLVNQHHEPSRCHSFVENGHIRFLGDCHHDLKNQTVELPELDDDGQPITSAAEKAAHRALADSPCEQPCVGCRGTGEHHWLHEYDKQTDDFIVVCMHCPAWREMTDEDFD